MAAIVKKLTPAQQLVVDVIKEHTTAVLGQKTDKKKGEVHAPTAFLLERRRIVTISGIVVHGKARRVARMAPFSSSLAPSTSEREEDKFLDEMEQAVKSGRCTLRYALANTWLNATDRARASALQPAEPCPECGPGRDLDDEVDKGLYTEAERQELAAEPDDEDEVTRGSRPPDGGSSLGHLTRRLRGRRPVLD